MNREIFALGIMMEFGGLGLLIVAGLFVAMLDLARGIFVPGAKRNPVVQRRCLSPTLDSTPGQDRSKFIQ